jgi:hypothetical protein
MVARRIGKRGDEDARAKVETEGKAGETTKSARA